MTVEALPLRSADREVKQLRGKKIALMKDVWGGLVGGSMTWESESQMKESHPDIFLSSNFRGRKSSKWWRVVMPRLRNFAIFNYFCIYCVIWLMSSTIYADWRYFVNFIITGVDWFWEWRVQKYLFNLFSILNNYLDMYLIDLNIYLNNYLSSDIILLLNLNNYLIG